MYIKLMFLSCLLGLGLNAKCQKDDGEFGHANLVCKYSMKWEFDTLNSIVKDDIIILQIGKDISKSYSYYTFQSDSLSNTPNAKEKWRMLFKEAMKKANGGIPTGFPHKRSKTYVYKNYPQGKMTITDGISLQAYIYEDELNAQKWEVLDSTKTILDNSCQLAKCTFRDRQWIAWFTSEIPISDGPWKFGGLPGLILEVHDIGKQYHFVMIGIEKKEEPIVFSKTYMASKKFEKTKRLKFLKAKRAYLMNKSGYNEMETGIDLGSNSSQKVMCYDLIERDY